MFEVPKKELPNFNFSMPEEIAGEFRRIGDVHGERNKLRWSVAGAAVLRLLEMPPDEMHELIRQVAGARHYPDKIDELVAEAKARAEMVYVPLPRTAYDAFAARAAKYGYPDVPSYLTRLAEGTPMQHFTREGPGSPNPGPPDGLRLLPSAPAETTAPPRKSRRQRQQAR